MTCPEQAGSRRGSSLEVTQVVVSAVLNDFTDSQIDQRAKPAKCLAHGE